MNPFFYEIANVGTVYGEIMLIFVMGILFGYRNIR